MSKFKEFNMSKFLKESKKFEQDVKVFLSKEWGVNLAERKVKIGSVFKKFDLVSEGHALIGDAKYYKNISVPAAKWSAIAEYVWLLEKTPAERKFLIFGKDIEVPQRWLKRFGGLTEVEFYFFDGKKLISLSKKRDLGDGGGRVKSLNNLFNTDY